MGCMAAHIPGKGGQFGGESPTHAAAPAHASQKPADLMLHQEMAAAEPLKDVPPSFVSLPHSIIHLLVCVFICMFPPFVAQITRSVRR